MSLTKKVLLLIGIISFGINLVASSTLQTTSQGLSQIDKKLHAKLLKASKLGYVDDIRELKRKRVSIDASDNEGRTALHHAVCNGHVECAMELVGGADIDARDHEGGTALHHAVYNGHVELVKILIHCRAYTDAQDRNGSTPLHHAAYNGHVKSVKVLLESRAHTDARDDEGRTALHYAARSGHVDCTKLLLNRGVNIKTQDNTGWTALDYAAYNGHVKCVDLLLYKGTSHCNKNTIKKVLKISYLLLQPSEEDILSARELVKASLWTLSHGPVVENSQTGERRRIGLPAYPCFWALLSDSDELSNADKCYGNQSLSKAVVYIFLNALGKDKSKELGLLGDAKEAAVKYLLEELKKRIPSLGDLPNIESGIAELLDPDSDVINIESEVIAGIDERIEELKNQSQDNRVSFATTVSSNSVK